MRSAREKRNMSRNTEKIKAALEARIAGMPQGNSGYIKPGSMNKKKTGYVKIPKNSVRGKEKS